MFINDQDHTIEDFLQAVNFVAPKGMSLKYFIVPYAANTEALMAGAGQYGFEPEPTIQANAQDVPGVTDTITYAKKDYTNRQSFNDSNFNLNQVPNEFPITRQGATSMEPMQTDLIAAGANIQSPIKGVKVLESMTGTSDIFIKESFSILPKNTLLHFEKSKMEEMANGLSHDPRLDVGNTKFFTQNTGAKGTITGARPFTKDGDLRLYAKIISAIVANPFSTKREIQRMIDEPIDPNYNNNLWSAIHKAGFFRITTKGEYVPTAKAVDWCKKHELDTSPVDWY